MYFLICSRKPAAGLVQKRKGVKSWKDLFPAVCKVYLVTARMERSNIIL